MLETLHVAARQSAGHGWLRRGLLGSPNNTYRWFGIAFMSCFFVPGSGIPTLEGFRESARFGMFARCAGQHVYLAGESPSPRCLPNLKKGIHIYIYICMYVCIYTYIYTLIIYIHIYIYIMDEAVHYGMGARDIEGGDILSWIAWIAARGARQLTVGCQGPAPNAHQVPSQKRSSRNT